MFVEIYARPGCSRCEAAERLLTSRAAGYRLRDASQAPVAAELRARQPDAGPLPQVFIDGDYVGGLEDLRAWLGPVDTPT